MKKMIVIGLILLVCFSMLFGCTQIDPNTPKVTNDSQADQTRVDAGSDISNITEKLNEIDSDLTA